MSNECSPACLKQRQIAAAYFAGAMNTPLELPHEDGFCVCDVLSATWSAKLRAAVRSIFVMPAVNACPFSSVKVTLLRLAGARIGRNVFISPEVIIDPIYPNLIELEDDVLLGMGCRLFTHEYTATAFRVGRIRIGKGSVIGAYATVRSGVTIGRKVTVGFNSYVNRDVADGLTVGGVPAKPISKAESHGAQSPEIAALHR